LIDRNFMQENLSSIQTRLERQRLQVPEPPESPQERVTGLFGDEKKLIIPEWRV